jgi:hypothetical protein
MTPNDTHDQPIRFARSDDLLDELYLRDPDPDDDMYQRYEYEQRIP